MSLNVLILAAGFGTRLNELGVNLPKGLIGYQDSTLLGLMLTNLKGSLTPGDNLALITNNRFFNQYQTYLKDNFPELNIEVINNGVDLPEKRLGALGDLKLAISMLGWQDEDLLVLPSDTFFSFSISDLLAFYLKHQGFVTVLREFKDTAEIANRLGCGVLEGDRIVEFVEKSPRPPSNFAAIPLYIYPKNILVKLEEYAQEGNSLDSPGLIVGWLIKKQIPVYGFTYKGQSLDVGTPEDIVKLKTL